MIYENEQFMNSTLTDIAEASGDQPGAAGRMELPDHCKYKYLLHLQVGCFSYLECQRSYEC